MKLVREYIEQAGSILGTVDCNSTSYTMPLRLEKARVLAELAKAEAMIEIGGELKDISTALNNIDGSLVHLDR